MHLPLLDTTRHGVYLTPTSVYVATVRRRAGRLQVVRTDTEPIQTNAALTESPDDERTAPVIAALARLRERAGRAAEAVVHLDASLTRFERVDAERAEADDVLPAALEALPEAYAAAFSVRTWAFDTEEGPRAFAAFTRTDAVAAAVDRAEQAGWSVASVVPLATAVPMLTAHQDRAVIALDDAGSGWLLETQAGLLSAVPTPLGPLAAPSEDGAAGIAEGTTAALAEAEAARLGFSPPPAGFVAGSAFERANSQQPAPRWDDTAVSDTRRRPARWRSVSDLFDEAEYPGERDATMAGASLAAALALAALDGAAPEFLEPDIVAEARVTRMRSEAVQAIGAVGTLLLFMLASLMIWTHVETRALVTAEARYATQADVLAVADAARARLTTVQERWVATRRLVADRSRTSSLAEVVTRAVPEGVWLRALSVECERRPCSVSALGAATDDAVVARFLEGLEESGRLVDVRLRRTGAVEERSTRVSGTEVQPTQPPRTFSVAALQAPTSDIAREAR